MIILRQSEFSKKPKRLRKYKDYDGSKMTKSQQRAAIEEEDETAAYNTSRYQSKHGWRGAGIGAGAGAIGGRALAGRGHGITGALAGAAIGGTIGIIRGTNKARKDGHDRDRRSTRLARKFDEENAKRGIESELEYQNKRDIRDRHKEDLDRQRNYYMAQMAWNSWK